MQASRAVVTPENAAQMRIVLARMAGAVDQVARALGDTPDVRILYHSLGWLEGEADMLARNAPLEHTPGVPYNGGTDEASERAPAPGARLVAAVGGGKESV